MGDELLDRLLPPSFDAAIPPTPISTIETAPDAIHQQQDKRSWLAGFRRVTTSGRFIPEIDGLRFIAIAAVVLDHLATSAGNALQRSGGVFGYGAHGVELFFVISGFVLAMPFAAARLHGEKPVRLRDYFLRRVLRLEPPYLLALILVGALKVIRDARWWPAILPYFGYSAVYINNIMTGRVGVVSVVTWSLEIEIQFYVLMPLFALVYLIRNRWIRRAILVGGSIAIASAQSISFPSQMIPNRLHLLNYLQYFWMGLLLADIYAVEWDNHPPIEKRGWFAWGDLVWLVCWPLIAWNASRGEGWLADPIQKFAMPPLIGIAYFSLFYSVLARRLMRTDLIVVLGGMCYSIYLLHNTVILSVAAMINPILPGTFPAAMLVTATCALPMVLVVCGLYFKFVEQPCMRRDWPQRAWTGLNRLIFVEDEMPAANDS